MSNAEIQALALAVASFGFEKETDEKEPEWLLDGILKFHKYQGYDDDEAGVIQSVHDLREVLK